MRPNLFLAQITNPQCIVDNKEAVTKFGSEASGKNLPFSSLSDKLKKKTEE